MSQAQTRNLIIALAGTIVAHVAFVVLAVVLAIFYDAREELLRSLDAASASAGQEEEMVIEFTDAPEQPVPPSVTEPPKPPEAAIAAAEQAVPKPQDLVGIRYVDTDGLPSTTAPLASDQAKFLSDKNTRAASEGVGNAAADPNLPTQAGVDSNVINMTDKKFVDGEVAPGELKATAQAAVPEAAKPEMTPPKPKIVEPAPVADAEEPSDDPDAPSKPKETVAAMSEPKLPAPELLPQTPTTELAKPEPSKAGLKAGDSQKVVQGFTQKNKMIGGVSTKGQASVDAADSPQGRYMARVSDAVQKTFQPACFKMRGKLIYGTVPLNFDINLKGEPSNLTITEFAKGNVVNQEVALDAVARAKFPPIPAELQGYLIDGKLNISFLFTFR